MKKNGKILQVLIVDDEPLIRDGLYRLLKNSEEVKTVATPEEALHEICAQDYDLCFLDF